MFLVSRIFDHSYSSRQTYCSWEPHCGKLALQLCGRVFDRLQRVQHNVLIDQRGDAYVTDFGLSAILAECDNLPFDAHHQDLSAGLRLN